MVKILGLPSKQIAEYVKNGNATLCVMGLGYVGLPLAVLFAFEGAKVIGCDIRKEIVDRVNKGESVIVERDAAALLSSGGRLLESRCPTCSLLLVRVKNEVFCPHCLRLATVTDGRVHLQSRTHVLTHPSDASLSDLNRMLSKVASDGTLVATTDATKAVHDADVVLIAVGTPVDSNNQPNYDALTSASESIGRGLTPNTLVILKSTVSPGVTKGIVGKTIEAVSGLKMGEDFGLAHMPERILEGFALLSFRTLPRNVAGVDAVSTSGAASVFSIFPAPIHQFSDPKITESAKLFENIYRDVNIALANELAKICEAIDVDIMDAISAARTDPKTGILTPGPGVGGYCLTKDTYHLSSISVRQGFTPQLLLLARSINDDMPKHVTKLVLESFRKIGRPIKGAKVTFLGVAFKANTDDLRSTPVKPIVDELTLLGANVTVHDPLADPGEIRRMLPKARMILDLNEALREAVCVVVTTDHNQYRSLTVNDLIKNAEELRAVVDSRHVFNPQEVADAGLVYAAVGHPMLYRPKHAFRIRRDVVGIPNAPKRASSAHREGASDEELAPV